MAGTPRAQIAVLPVHHRRMTGRHVTTPPAARHPGIAAHCATTDRHGPSASRRWTSSVPASPILSRKARSPLSHCIITHAYVWTHCRTPARPRRWCSPRASTHSSASTSNHTLCLPRHVHVACLYCAHTILFSVTAEYSHCMTLTCVPCRQPPAQPPSTQPPSMAPSPTHCSRPASTGPASAYPCSLAWHSSLSPPPSSTRCVRGAATASHSRSAELHFG